MSYSPVIDTNTIKTNVAAFIMAVVQQTAQGPAGGGSFPFSWSYKWQTAVKLQKPYAEFSVTGPRRIGSFDEKRQVTVASTPTIQMEGEREYTVSINCVSDDETGPNLATTLMSALQAEQYASILEANGAFSVRDIHGIQDLTSQLQDGTKYERRAVLDFNLGAVSQLLNDVPDLETVAGTVTGQPGQNGPIVIQLTAPPP